MPDFDNGEIPYKFPEKLFSSPQNSNYIPVIYIL